MLLPTQRTILLGFLPLLVILFGRGAHEAVVSAWLFCGALALTWLWDGLSMQEPKRLSLRRQSPHQMHVDQQHTIEWQVENRNPVPVAIQLRDLPPAGTEAVPYVLQATIPAHAQTTLTYSLVPTKRGNLEFGDVYYRILGQLGLAWRQFRMPARQPIRCYPHLANWTAADLAARESLVRQTGNRRYRWRGTGTIFESLREYTSDDDIRWVDWKATARAQHPISRNFETERHQQVILLVDASRMMSTYCGNRTKFDAVLEAAVLAGRSAIDQGDSVGLMLFSDKPDLYLHPRRERSQVGRIMDGLYDREPRLVEPDFETAITLSAQRNQRRSLVILFTDVTVIESAKRMAVRVRGLIPRHLPLVVTISDDAVARLESLEPRDANDLYQVGAAHELQQQREELLEFLRNSGAAVLDSPADQVAVATIQTYLDLKRRMRL